MPGRLGNKQFCLFWVYVDYCYYCHHSDTYIHSYIRPFSSWQLPESDGDFRAGTKQLPLNERWNLKWFPSGRHVYCCEGDIGRNTNEVAAIRQLWTVYYVKYSEGLWQDFRAIPKLGDSPEVLRLSSVWKLNHSWNTLALVEVWCMLDVSRN